MALRRRWQAGETTLGGWLQSPSIVTAEALARVTVGGTGFDYVCVDMQHGAIDYSAAVGQIQAIELAGGTPLTRVPWNEPGIIAQMLDAGAQGVIVPMVNTAEQAKAVVQACRFAPHGSRSFGPVMAGMRQADYLAWAEANVACIPMVETVEALSNLDEIVSVAGVDAVYVGPADLALSLGFAPQSCDGEPLFDDALAAVVAACRRHGVVPGIHSTGPLTPRRLEQGFQMVTVTSDMLAMSIGLGSELNAARGGNADGTVDDASSPAY